MLWSALRQYLGCPCTAQASHLHSLKSVWSWCACIWSGSDAWTTPSNADIALLLPFLAGTPLGDPIEVGAALAVFAEAPRHQPLALAASKSWVGHAEPAAGLAGLLFALGAASQQLALPLMHLTTVNPYVASTLDQQQQRSKGMQPGLAVADALLPRQGGPLPHAEEQQQGCIWGVSAFAFQGTNAHALLEVAAATSDAPEPDSAAVPAWQHKRQHVLPMAHQLISAAAVAGNAGRGAAPSGRALFHAELAGASLAFLWDHQVLGKALFPGEQLT